MSALSRPSVFLSAPKEANTAEHAMSAMKRGRISPLSLVSAKLPPTTAAPSTILSNALKYVFAGKQPGYSYMWAKKPVFYLEHIQIDALDRI